MSSFDHGEKADAISLFDLLRAFVISALVISMASSACSGLNWNPSPSGCRS